MKSLREFNTYAKNLNTMSNVWTGLHFKKNDLQFFMINCSKILADLFNFLKELLQNFLWAWLLDSVTESP